MNVLIPKLQKSLRVLFGLYLISFLLTNLLCLADYETVSLLDSWSRQETRYELLLLSGILTLVLSTGCLIRSA